MILDEDRIGFDAKLVGLGEAEAGLDVEAVVVPGAAQDLALAHIGELRPRLSGNRLPS